MNVILDDDSSCPAETRRSLERNIDENVIRDNIPEASVSVRGSNDAELEVRTLSWVSRLILISRREMKLYG